jgi:hypothetical protein
MIFVWFGNHVKKSTPCLFWNQILTCRSVSRSCWASKLRLNSSKKTSSFLIKWMEGEKKCSKIILGINNKICKIKNEEEFSVPFTSQKMRELELLYDKKWLG